MSLRLTSIGRIAKPPVRRLEPGGAAEPKERRPVYFAEAGDYVDCPIYDRYALAAGAAFAGPAVVEEFDSTTVVHPGFGVTRGRRRESDHREGGSVSADGTGIVLSKNVMVPMRDGVRLAFDIYRPARDGDFVEGRFPTIMLHTPYDKTDKRYSEIADFFVPKGYNVVLIDLRDRYCSEASGVYYHAATPHTGRDGYDICEWIGTQPWSNGKIGTVGSSYAAITQVRTALEAPPHLTAIWPDVVPTNSFQNQCREGGAMQQHMFWALFIHAQDAQDVRDDWSKAGEVWDDLKNLRAALPGDAVDARARRRSGTCRRSRTRCSTTTRAAPTTSTGTGSSTTTRSFWDQHADIPVTFSTGWYDPFPAADTEYFAAMTAKNSAPAAARRSARGATSACAATRRSATRSTSASQSVWGVQRYFEEQLDFFNRWLPDDAPGQPPGEAPVRIFVMGGGSRPQDGRAASSTTAGAGARSRSGRSRGRVDDAVLPPRRRRRSRPSEPPAGATPRDVHLRPGASGADARRPLLLDRRAAGRRAGDGAGLGAAAQPGAAAARPAHARARSTRRSRPRSSAPRRRTRGCRSGPTCSSSRRSR